MVRPLLVVGDVQGDVERLQEALGAYPEDEVDTVFLGDFFQGGLLGRGGGAAAARTARARRNSRAVLGNHDLFLLAVLERRRGVQPPEPWARSPADLEALWLGRRGDWADLAAVEGDAGLETWLRDLPFMILLDDGTLVQHTDDDMYANLGDSVDAVNATARAWLGTPGGVFTAVRTLFGRGAFVERSRLDVYLEHFGARRLVHGHTPHWEDGPTVGHDGRLWGFDGRFSRYWPREEGELTGPIGATVALLPRLGG